jgi:cold-inducible RNA-binding protein
MNPQNQKLYVGNLNFDATEDQVRELFAAHGEVAEVKIIMDRFSGRSRGFAFVRMATSEGATKAKDALHGQPFQGKALVIDWARTEQRDRPPMGERRGPAGGGEFRPRREWSGGDRSERRESRGGNDRYFR